MAIPTITETIEVAGRRQHGHVDIELVASTSGSALAYTNAGEPLTIGGKRTIALVDGQWSAQLNPNAGSSDDAIATPENTVYRLTYRLTGSTQIAPVYITAPDDADEHQVATRLTNEPTNLGQSIADLVAEGLEEISDAVTDGIEAVASGTGMATSTALTAEASARAAADALLIPLAQKGANSGVAPLNSSGKIARTYRPALAEIDFRDWGAAAKGDGLTDNTTALNEFFDACAPSAAAVDSEARNRGYLPPGWYFASQIGWSSGSYIDGAGWGMYGPIFQPSNPTAAAADAARSLSILQQLPGVNDHFILCRDPSLASHPISGKPWFGPAGLRNLVIIGDKDSTAGHGIAFFDEADGDPCTLTDQVWLDQLFVSGFAEDGIHAPGGAVPLHWGRIMAMRNGRDGVHFEAGAENAVQAVHFEMISGDSNGQALLYIEGVPRMGSVTIDNVKSEQSPNGWRGGAGTQDAIRLHNCDRAPIKINGLTHVRSDVDPLDSSKLLAPTPPIRLTGTSIPILRWEAVSQRVWPTTTTFDGTEGTVRDDVNSYTVPLERYSGSYGTVLGSSDDPPVHLPAAALSLHSGTPALGTVGGGKRTAWLFDGAGATEQVAGSFLVPPGWGQVYVVAEWCNAGAGAGDVRWYFRYNQFTEGDDLNNADSVIASTKTAGALNILTRSSFLTPLTVVEGRRLHFRIERNSADAADTLANDAGLLAIYFRRSR